MDSMYFFYEDDYPETREFDYHVRFFYRRFDGNGYYSTTMEYVDKEAAMAAALREVDELHKAVGAVVTCLWDQNFVLRCGFIPKRKGRCYV